MNTSDRRPESCDPAGASAGPDPITAADRVVSAYESVADGLMILDRDRRYAYVNAAAERIVGRRRRELLGGTLWAARPPALGTEAEARPQRVAAVREGCDFIGHDRAADRWYENRVVPTPDGDAAVYVRDVTGRRRAEVDVRQSEERFRRYFDLGLIGKAMTAPDKGAIEVNDEIGRVLGYTRDELLRGTWAGLTRPDDLLYRVLSECVHNALQDARAARVNVPVERRDRHVTALVDDDGAEFDAVLACPPPGRLGLLGARERLALIGGSLEVESAPGSGTTVFARFPVPPDARGGCAVIPIRVFLADDHAVVREGLKSLLAAQPGVEVVGEAGDGYAAVAAVRDLMPDVVVMDITMPGLGGSKATERLRRECPGVKVLALTVHEDKAYLRQLLEAGATGYVLKRAAAGELVQAVRAVAGGGCYLDPALAGHVAGGFVSGAAARETLAGCALSDREEEVVRLIAEGYSNKQIAARLTLSVKTVETYKTRSLEKLGLRDRIDLVRYARQQGWLKPT